MDWYGLNLAINTAREGVRKVGQPIAGIVNNRLASQDIAENSVVAEAAVREKLSEFEKNRYTQNEEGEYAFTTQPEELVEWANEYWETELNRNFRTSSGREVYRRQFFQYVNEQSHNIRNLNEQYTQKAAFDKYADTMEAITNPERAIRTVSTAMEAGEDVGNRMAVAQGLKGLSLQERRERARILTQDAVATGVISDPVEAEEILEGVYFEMNVENAVSNATEMGYVQGLAYLRDQRWMGEQKNAVINEFIKDYTIRENALRTEQTAAAKEEWTRYMTMAANGEAFSAVDVMNNEALTARWAPESYVRELTRMANEMASDLLVAEANEMAARRAREEAEEQGQEPPQPVSKPEAIASIREFYNNPYIRNERVMAEIHRRQRRGELHPDDAEEWMDTARNRTVSTDLIEGRDYIESIYTELMKSDNANVEELSLRMQEDIEKYFRYVAEHPGVQEKIGERGSFTTQLAQNLIAERIEYAIDAQNNMDEIRPETSTRHNVDRIVGSRTMLKKDDTAGLTDAEEFQMRIDNDELYGMEHEYEAEIQELRAGYQTLMSEQFGWPEGHYESRIEPGGKIRFYRATTARNAYATAYEGSPLRQYAIEFRVNPNTNDHVPVIWNDQLGDWEPMDWERAKSLLMERSQ